MELYFTAKRDDPTKYEDVDEKLVTGKIKIHEINQEDLEEEELALDIT